MVKEEVDLTADDSDAACSHSSTRQTESVLPTQQSQHVIHRTSRSNAAKSHQQQFYEQLRRRMEDAHKVEEVEAAIGAVDDVMADGSLRIPREESRLQGLRNKCAAKLRKISQWEPAVNRSQQISTPRGHLPLSTALQPPPLLHNICHQASPSPKGACSQLPDNSEALMSLLYHGNQAKVGFAWACPVASSWAQHFFILLLSCSCQAKVFSYA